MAAIREVSGIFVLGRESDADHNRSVITLAGEPSPEIYMPYAQRPWRTMNLIMRTTGDPYLLADAVRRQVATVDPDQPVTLVRTMEEVLAASRTQPRLVIMAHGRERLRK